MTFLTQMAIFQSNCWSPKSELYLFLCQSEGSWAAIKWSLVGAPAFSPVARPLQLSVLPLLTSKADESGWQWHIREDCVDETNTFTFSITPSKTER